MVHSLLRALRTTTPAFGAWLTLPSVHTARQIALAGRTCGLSWVCIDCEHGLTSIAPGIAETIAAVTALPPLLVPGDAGGDAAFSVARNPSVLVRVPAPGVEYSGPSTAHQIKQALDAGAHGIIVPMVANAAIARQVALDARFPPIGK